MLAQTLTTVLPASVLQPPTAYYVAAALVVILLSGFGVGFIVRASRARRDLARSEDRLETVRAELEEFKASSAMHPQPVLPHAPPAARLPMRWTATEIVALLGAVGTLVGSVGTVWISLRNSEAKQQAGRLVELTQRNDSLERGMKALLFYDIGTWQRMREAPLAADDLPREVAGSHTRANCTKTRPQLTYGGGLPAMLQCPAGQARVTLRIPTRVLLVPDSMPPNAK